MEEVKSAAEIRREKRREKIIGLFYSTEGKKTIKCRHIGRQLRISHITVWNIVTEHQKSLENVAV